MRGLMVSLNLRYLYEDVVQPSVHVFEGVFVRAGQGQQKGGSAVSAVVAETRRACGGSNQIVSVESVVIGQKFTSIIG